jgi:hypothetical protein
MKDSLRCKESMRELKISKRYTQILNEGSQSKSGSVYGLGRRNRE